MTRRENILSLYRRTGYEKAPVQFEFCPSLIDTFQERENSELSYDDYFGFSVKEVRDGILQNPVDDEVYKSYYDVPLKPGTTIDIYGVAHEPGSAAAKHMTYMRNPLKSCDSLQKMQEYPYPDFKHASYDHQAAEVAAIHAADKLAFGNVSNTIWEWAWYIRGMEELMMDMMTEDPMAEFILDKTMEISIKRAEQFAKAGCDYLLLGDDVGMQKSIMMSEQLYCTWLKPRLKKVIDHARKIKPDILIIYHSCGYVEPFIPHFIEAGVDILNPVQPECMDFKKIHQMYGDRLSFNGTLGTQTVMPFGTPDDVRRKVFENLEIAGDKGGLLCCPTHMLEPEVPWENILAYVKACEDFK